MSNSLEHGLILAEYQFFPLLRKEVLEVRLARIEAAAKILQLNEDVMKGS